MFGAQLANIFVWFIRFSNRSH